MSASNTWLTQANPKSARRTNNLKLNVMILLIRRSSLIQVLSKTAQVLISRHYYHFTEKRRRIQQFLRSLEYVVSGRIIFYQNDTNPLKSSTQTRINCPIVSISFAHITTVYLGMYGGSDSGTFH